MNLSVLPESAIRDITAPHTPAQPDPVPTPVAPANNAALPEVLQFLKDLGLPAIPVAPVQDPHADGRYRKSPGNGDRQWAHCPLTADHKPEPLFTGKNPSYLDRNGNPHLIRHTAYQNRLPNEQEQKIWWQNSDNGIGTLGGWGGYIWLDFDLKQFESQEDCDCAFYGLLEANPQLLDSWWEQTHSGGYRLAVKPIQQPSFTNFALEPGGKHRGEALGKGRFTVLAPTIGSSGNPYQCQNRAIPVEVESLEAIGIFPTQPESKPRRPLQKREKIAVSGAIALEQLGSNTATATLRGDDFKGDRSDSLATAYREWSGWENWAHAQGIAISGSAEDLAHQAGEALGIDGDRVDRILKGIDAAQCQPAALHRGSEENCWKKIRRLDRATFNAAAPPSVRDTLEALYAKPDRGSGNPPGGGGSGNGGSGDGDSDSFNSGNDWNTPVSCRGEIGVWIKPKGSDEVVFDPCCNFDFQIIRELHSEDGGGIEITLKRSFDRHETVVFIQSVDYTSTDKFIDALKKALGTGVVCNLTKYQLNALMHTRIKQYRQRDEQTYRLIERRGRQRDGTWVFKDKQFKADGTPTTTEESGWVYIKNFPNSEDFIPEPAIADYDPEALPRYVKAKQKTFGANFPQS